MTSPNEVHEPTPTRLPWETPELHTLSVQTTESGNLFPIETVTSDNSQPVGPPS